MIFATLDAHLPHAPDIAAAAVAPGMLFAWCANMRLLAPAVEETFATELLRLRVREVKGSEVLVATGGALTSEMVNDDGRRFLADYHPRFDEDYRSVFGADVYAVADTWANYDELAPVLTRRLLGEPPRPAQGWTARLRSWFGR